MIFDWKEAQQSKEALTIELLFNDETPNNSIQLD